MIALTFLFSGDTGGRSLLPILSTPPESGQYLLHFLCVIILVGLAWLHYL